MKGFKSWLEDRLTSENFPAYQIEQENENGVEALFASEQGKEFSIDYIGPDSINFFLTVSVDEKCLPPLAFSNPQGSSHGKILGVRTSWDIYLPFALGRNETTGYFIFSSSSLMTETEEEDRITAAFGRLNTLTVKVYRVTQQRVFEGICPSMAEDTTKQMLNSQQSGKKAAMGGFLDHIG